MYKPYTDIRTGDWIDRFLSPPARPYARLMRLDRPIGTWLLLLPCWWGVALGGDVGRGLGYMLLFTLGAVIMRGAGCTINDLYDRDFDRQVERTRTRPLASGAITVPQACLFLAIQLLCGLAILLFFNPITIKLGIASLFLVVIYPLAKRVTFWPQLVLGLAFNWGVWLGWASMHDSVSAPAAWFYFGGIFWTLGYDTIYAHQDKRDDAAIGVKSLALKFGDRSRQAVGIFYGIAVLFFAIGGYADNLHRYFYLLLAAAGIQAIWQTAGWQIDDQADCLKRFRSNRDFGLILLAAILIGRI